jgi:hypothetical protein
MMRHKEKDDEAGGDGLGVLQTRKRLWRDSSGAVVAKRRPEHEKSNRAGGSRPRNPPSAMISVERSPVAAFNEMSTPLSPPGSSLGHSSNEPESIKSSESAIVPASADDLWPISMDDDVFPMSGVDSYDFLCNASWGTQIQDKGSTDILYNDMFAPDTG